MLGLPWELFGLGVYEVKEQWQHNNILMPDVWPKNSECSSQQSQQFLSSAFIISLLLLRANALAPPNLFFWPRFCFLRVRKREIIHTNTNSKPAGPLWKNSIARAHMRGEARKMPEKSGAERLVAIKHFVAVPRWHQPMCVCDVRIIICTRMIHFWLWSLSRWLALKKCCAPPSFNFIAAEWEF